MIVFVDESGGEVCSLRGFFVDSPEYRAEYVARIACAIRDAEMDFRSSWPASTLTVGDLAVGVLVELVEDAKRWRMVSNGIRLLNEDMVHVVTIDNGVPTIRSQHVAPIADEVMVYYGPALKVAVEGFDEFRSIAKNVK